MEQEDLNKEIPLQMELLLKHNHLYRIINRKRKKEPPKPPKQELSIAERQKRKKMLIMPLFFLIFGGAMWLIFAPIG